jgi:hypothetical protein
MCVIRFLSFTRKGDGCVDLSFFWMISKFILYPQVPDRKQSKKRSDNQTMHFEEKKDKKMMFVKKGHTTNIHPSHFF